MLRSRLYIGMLPVAGLLILVSLYLVYSYTKLGNRLDGLHADNYATISNTERLLLAVSQIERSILLMEERDETRARSVYEESEPLLRTWLAGHTLTASIASSDSGERLIGLVNDLHALATRVFGEGNGESVSDELIPLVEEIEALGLDIVSGHKEAIMANSEDLRIESQQQYYVVVSAIVASVFLMGYLAYRLSERILAPIDALTLWAERLGEDDWDTDYEPSSKDEIARLEYAFVEMAARIREYKRITSKQIVRTRRRMEQCFSNLPYPVLFLNSRQRIAYTNPAAVELVERQCWEDELLPQLEARIATVFGTGEEVVVTEFEETVSARFDGEERHFLPIFVRVDSEEAEDIECGVLLQDVTRLRLSDELKSDLVATVSHEIKTPVTSATMALHLVLEKSLGELTEDQEEMLQTANSDLNRLKRLLNNLLEIARLESRSPRIERSEVDAQTLLEGVREDYANAAQNRDIEVSLSIEEDMPTVELDVKAMEVGLSNYLSNAIKYSPRESRVELYARRVGEKRIRFGVRDEGPGMPEEELEKVFEKFFRSSQHRKLEGIGLGLSIVRDIAMAHGGNAGCELRDPKGCDFYIEIEGPADERE